MPPGRKTKAWVVVNERGWPFLDTVRQTKRAACAAYPHVWDKDRRLRGVRAVKCTLEVHDG